MERLCNAPANVCIKHILYILSVWAFFPLEPNACEIQKEKSESRSIMFRETAFFCRKVCIYTLTHKAFCVDNNNIFQ